MKRSILMGGKTLALAALLICGTAAFGADMALADTAQIETTAGIEPAVPAVSGQITSYKITGDKQNVGVAFNSSGDAVGADGNVYVFEMQPYKEELGGRRDSAVSAAALGSTSIAMPLSLGMAQDRLYSRFQLAMCDGTQSISISKPHYITNPEIVAKNTTAFKDPLFRKGPNIEIGMLEDAFDLGVKHVTTSIVFSQIMGTGIAYQYDGKTYHFNKAVVDVYDKTISALSNKGMTIAVTLLNDWNPNTPDLIYPGTQKSSNTSYYMFNAGTESGFEQTKTIASFLADHYGEFNPSYSKMSNWITGNEINSQQWNYVSVTDLTSYVRVYQKAFQVIYIAIKSTNASDRVYFSLDYNWMNEIGGRLKYGSRQIVDNSNSIANAEGQMDWDLAYHPCPCPTAGPGSWDDPQTTGLFTNGFNSPVINFTSLSVLTGYFVRETLRTPSGHVCHIILTEQDFTSCSPTKGNIPETQVTAYAYPYYLADSSPYIDAYIVSRQADAPSEAKDGLKFGLWKCDMNQPNLIVATKCRKIWQIFQDIDKKNSTLETTEFAKSIIDISKQSDVIPNSK